MRSSQAHISQIALFAKRTYGLVQKLLIKGVKACHQIMKNNVTWDQTVGEDHYLSAEGLILSSRVLEELGSLLLSQSAGLTAGNISVSSSWGLIFLSHRMCAWTRLITKGNCIQSISIFGEDHSSCFFVCFSRKALRFLFFSCRFLFYFRGWVHEDLGKSVLIQKNLKGEATDIFWRQS